jgi:predicted amidohydrolase YtcJ
LAVGESADLAILSANPLTQPEDEILGIDVLATLREGIVTHSSQDLEI